MCVVPLFPIVSLSIRPLLPASALAHPLLRTSLRPNVCNALRRKTIIRSCYYRPTWAARSKSVAGPCCTCCIQRCVPGKRVWLHFFALLSVSTAAQKGLHLLFQTNLLLHQHCVSGLLFPRPFFAGLARTDFSTPRCTPLCRRSLKCRYDEEQVFWSILKDFCFIFVCFCGRASPARHGPGGKATPDCLPVSISSRSFALPYIQF
jgi:hypothetical protein